MEANGLPIAMAENRPYARIPRRIREIRIHFEKTPQKAIAPRLGAYETA